MNPRNTLQLRQNLLMDALEIARTFRLTSQEIIRPARHQVTFADFWITPHRVLKPVEKILRLAVERDLHDDRDHLAAGEAAGQRRIAPDDTLPFQNIDPAKAGRGRKADFRSKFRIADAGIEPEQADDVAVCRVE